MNSFKLYTSSKIAFSDEVWWYFKVTASSLTEVSVISCRTKVASPLSLACSLFKLTLAPLVASTASLLFGKRLFTLKVYSVP